jgi:hypothetical protein
MANDRGPHASKLDAVMPPCRRCGRKDWWYNNVPLYGYCWGPDDKPHKEVKVLVPKPHNPYL